MTGARRFDHAVTDGPRGGERIVVSIWRNIDLLSNATIYAMFAAHGCASAAVDSRVELVDSALIVRRCHPPDESGEAEPSQVIGHLPGGVKACSRPRCRVDGTGGSRLRSRRHGQGRCPIASIGRPCLDAAAREAEAALSAAFAAAPASTPSRS
jgi:hypothetical protein